MNPTGMLGAASSERMHDVVGERWKRLMSPHGIFHVPKSAVSVSDAAASAASFISALVRFAM